MRKFYQLTFDADRNDIIGCWMEYGETDFSLFWNQQKLEESTVGKVIFCTDDDDKYVNNTHVVPNPMGLLIISDKMLEYTYSYIEKDVQIFPISIMHNGTYLKSAGFNLIHPIVKIDCIDKESSKIIFDDKDGGIAAITELKLNKDKIPKGINLFKLGEVTNEIIVSDEFVTPIKGKKMNGIALIRCKN